MVDIWGRSLSAKTSKDDKTTDDVKKKLIKDEIASTLNLASVDTKEVVLFENEQGKLKSSNVSLDDILVSSREGESHKI